MRRKYGVSRGAVIVALSIWLGVSIQAAQPASGEQYVGKWSGTWEGSGSGRFELILERGPDGAVTGGVDVGSDVGNYVAEFKALAFDGNKMTGRYVYPLDEQADIALTATFEGGQARGTWSLVPKDQDMPLANGTWNVSKK
jgi:hypothetical protein